MAKPPEGAIAVIVLLVISLTTFIEECCHMAVVTVRNLPEETHRALRLRAAEHGRSTEAEIREILEAAVRPESRMKIGSELAAFGDRFGGIDLDILRDPIAGEPPTFE